MKSSQRQIVTPRSRQIYLEDLSRFLRYIQKTVCGFLYAFFSAPLVLVIGAVTPDVNNGHLNFYAAGL